jgi:hypothetical protein
VKRDEMRCGAREGEERSERIDNTCEFEMSVQCSAAEYSNEG